MSSELTIRVAVLLVLLTVIVRMALPLIATTAPRPIPASRVVP
jgi:hypothetical protein